MNKQFFCYSTGPVALVAAVGAVGTSIISIAADADFECQYFTGVAIQATLVVANWGGTVQINDSGVGRTMFDQAVPFNAVVGTAQQPYVILNPRRVPANSSLTVTFVNNAATATTVYLTLNGYKLNG